MDATTLARFNELAQAAAERRPLDLAELHEVGAVLSEVLQAVAAVAGHVESETAALGKRYALRDATGDPDPEARLAEVRERMRRVAEFLGRADLHARRTHGTINRIVQATPD
ncbi:hypothetical protein DP939_08645 [Spongiactinospora rosea]|uniref:Uncharacterized protein n=1 Tax=Spongiactinospora rosea TaxID=2248750 RepID=A0A366M682_9ACTN|nr:hypothetical protein [Spongiactinospora rosea]RBQ21104.1 hypothetical protein DP939_08645 [Spongiactinospora rosea]